MRSVLLVGWLVACGGSQIQERKVADLTRLGPATFETTNPREGEPREAKVRIWVDAGTRAGPRWKEEISEQIDYAGQLLTPLIGVRLKIEAFKEWERTGEPRDALRALADVDPGKEVAWVIGYIAPGDDATRVLAELGDAQLLGRHVVVRGWAEKPEIDRLMTMLPELKPAERTEVIAAHRRHKQTVVLLHGLARSLGAIDESDPAWIQNPSYAVKQASFSDRNRELLQLSIDHRLADDPIPEIAHDLVEKIEKEQWGGWLAPSRDEVIAVLRAIVTAGKAGQAAPDVPVAALEQFDRIKATVRTQLGPKQGESPEQRDQRARAVIANALGELDNLLIAYPANAAIHQLKCELMLVKPGVADKAARATCARVGELAPGDPSPHFAVADALVKAGDVRGARGELELAAGKIAKLRAGAEPHWKRLIATYSAMGALTWTEEAIAAAHLQGDPAAVQVASTRAHYGVPKGTKLVKPEDEAALVATLRGALDLVYASNYAAAETAIAAGEKKWPGAAGLAATRCDLALRRAQLDAAKAACQQALAADPNESWALYLSGVIAMKDTSAAGTKNGIEKLKKAIAVDPELGQAWRTLAKAYVRAKDQAALDQLGKDYATKFGQPLPQ